MNTLQLEAHLLSRLHDLTLKQVKCIIQVDIIILLIRRLFFGLKVWIFDDLDKVLELSLEFMFFIIELLDTQIGLINQIILGFHFLLHLMHIR